MKNVILGAAVAVLTLTACGPGEDAPCEKKSGEICTIAGTGKAGLGADEIDAKKTNLYLPMDSTIGPDGELYLVDWNNERIRKISSDGKIHGVLGTGELGQAEEGPIDAVSLNHPTDVCFDKEGRMLVTAWHNHKILRADFAANQVKVIAGTGSRGSSGDNGQASAAQLNFPVAMAFDSGDNLFFVDQSNNKIRRIDPAGVITTFSFSGTEGFQDGAASVAQMRQPFGQGAQPSAKMVMAADGTIFVADSGNNRVRKVTTDGTVSTIAGTGGSVAGIDAASYSGDNGPATQAQLARPTDLALGADGSLFVADTDNSCIRKIDPAGIITTVAGQCTQQGFEGDHGPATKAKLNQPYGITVDKDGVLYISDTFNHRIRAVYP